MEQLAISVILFSYYARSIDCAFPNNNNNNNNKHNIITTVTS